MLQHPPRPERRPSRGRGARLIATAVALIACLAAGPAVALELTERKLDVERIDIKTATNLADRLIKLDARGVAPIHLVITATDGSAQGVLILADTIRSLRSPVVGVVLTQIHGTGAALAPFTDRVVVFPSAGLIFTELEYEGVRKPEPPSETAAADKPADGKAAPKAEENKTQLLLQTARERFLERFYERLAQRLYMKGPTLAQAIADGGLMMTAEEAVAKRVAFAIVEQVSFVTIPTDKVEVKVVTTQKEVRAIPEDAVPERP